MNIQRAAEVKPPRSKGQKGDGLSPSFLLKCQKNLNQTTQKPVSLRQDVFGGESRLISFYDTQYLSKVI